MNIKSTFLVLVFILAVVFTPTLASAQTMAENLSGRIVLQVEAQGQAWYVNPANLRRYFLGRPADAFSIMKELGLGVTNHNLSVIPQYGDQWDGAHGIMQQVRGKILIQVEGHGEAWYVNPPDGKRYYLGTPDDAFRVMRDLGLGITNGNLNLIPTSDSSAVNSRAPAPTPAPSPAPLSEPNNSPGSVLIPVPFSAQAPHGDWSSPYDEACEETILSMLDHYYKNKQLTADSVTNDIHRMVSWEKANLSQYEDTGVADTARLAEEYLGYRATMYNDVSPESIRKLLDQGKPVIAPVSGRALNNPHFRAPGPLYHMVLIIGYDGDDFIVNDPGTRFGGNFRYSLATLMNAIHDLTSPESNITNGTPRVFVVE